MEERRSAARWQIDNRAKLTVEGGIKPIPCVVEDISTSGLRISLGRDLFPEVFSNFDLALSDDVSFNAGAQVAWSDKVYERNVYGLAFERLAEPAKERITQYVKDNFPDEMIKQVWKGI